MSIYSTVADAPRLPNTVVVIDVFRATNTIISLLSKGACRVVTVETVDQARNIKRDNAEWIFLGERGGHRLPDCDGDNSPAAVPEDIKGKSVVLSTSGGTRCIAACKPDQTVFLASFANAASLIRILRESAATEVGFWAAGLSGERPAEEDELCAQFLDSAWRSEIENFASVREKLLRSDGAKRLRSLGLNADLAFCTALDTHSVVPRRAQFSNHGWCFEN
jgi:2-phosphosulfolactate phosphatase